MKKIILFGLWMIVILFLVSAVHGACNEVDFSDCSTTPTDYVMYDYCDRTNTTSWGAADNPPVTYSASADAAIANNECWAHYVSEPPAGAESAFGSPSVTNQATCAFSYGQNASSNAVTWIMGGLTYGTSAIYWNIGNGGTFQYDVAGSYVDTGVSVTANTRYMIFHEFDTGIDIANISVWDGGTQLFNITNLATRAGQTFDIAFDITTPVAIQMFFLDNMSCWNGTMADRPTISIPDSYPSINLLNPANESIIDDDNVDVNISVIDDDTGMNATIYVSRYVNFSNFTLCTFENVASGNIYCNFNVTGEPHTWGRYYWKGNVTDSGEQTNETDIRWFELGIVNSDILFYDLDNAEQTLFDEGEEFIIRVNLTLNGLPITNSECNLSTQEGIIVTPYRKTNLTICDSASCDAETFLPVNLTNISINSALRDTIDLSICHEQVLKEDLIIDNIQCGATTVNSTIITAESIPLCLDGEALFRISLGTNCTSETHIQFLLLSLGSFPQRHRVTGLEVDREFTIDYDSMAYNSTNELYEVSPFHLHEYYEHGLKNISVDCSNDNTFLNQSRNETLTIVNVAPQVFHSIIRIDQTLETRDSIDYVFILIELFDVAVNISKNSNVTFVTTVVDTNLVNSTHLLHDIDGNLIWNESHVGEQDIHSINGSILFTGRFNFTTVAFDEEGGNTTLTTLFNFTNITDIYNPTMVFVNPSVNDTEIFVNETIIFQVNCSDFNLFQIQGNVSLTGFEDFATGFKQSTNQPDDFLSITFTPNSTGNGTVVWQCGDTGTGIYLDPNDFGYNDKGESTVNFTNFKTDFTFEISHAGSIPPLEDYTVKKLSDSYAWEICLSFPALAEEWEITEYIKGDFIYLDKSSIPGHFVSSDGHTFIKYLNEDSEPLDVINVVKSKEGEWTVVTRHKKSELCHDPLTGSTNTISETVTFNVVTPIPLGIFFRANVCPDDDIPTVLMTALIFIVLIVMFVLGRVYIKFPVIDIMVGLGMMVFGGAIVGCNFIIGIVVIMFGVIMICLAFID